MLSVEMLVMLRIEEIRRAGGIDNEDLQRVIAYAPEFARHGENLLDNGLLVKVCDAVAVLAFLPGGVPFDGRRYVA